MKLAIIPTKTSDLSSLIRVLNRIDDAPARKLVIISKWERGELTELEAEILIRDLGLANA